jgi:hypothetical protein
MGKERTIQNFGGETSWKMATQKMEKDMGAYD